MQVRLKSQAISFSALGDSALEISLGDASEAGVIERVHVLVEALKKENPRWINALLPAYGTVVIFYDAIKLPPSLGGEYEAACAWIKALAVSQGVLARRNPKLANKAKPIEIPVCYDSSLAPDLELVAAKVKLSVEAVIKLHSAVTYRVHAIGFAPGFPYLAGLNPKLKLPRLKTPREKVAAGSVGIGGDQTGIYPFATPGGWNIIGQTPVKLFDVKKEPPSLLSGGDEVIFKPITKEAFSQWI